MALSTREVVYWLPEIKFLDLANPFNARKG